MNKILFSSITMVMLSISVLGQIPNFSFENWTNNGTYDTPDNWSTLNSITSANSLYTASKGVPGNPGSTYLKLTSKMINGTAVNGVATCGELDPITLNPITGFPFSQQPKSFSGNYQFMAAFPGVIRVSLTKWNTQLHRRDTVAYIDQQLSGMEMSWKAFNLNFIYMNSEIPDSCLILMKASGFTPYNSDYLWVDNLRFTGDVAGLNDVEVTPSVFTISPNPTADFIEIKLNDLKTTTSKIELIDLKGTTLISKEIDPFIFNHTIDIRSLSKGNYIVRLISDSYSQEKKLCIE